MKELYKIAIKLLEYQEALEDEITYTMDASHYHQGKLQAVSKCIEIVNAAMTAITMHEENNVNK